MATIKPIENRSVHRIQSGQVIVDLCSVVKELVENSLDAGATSIEIRFKSNGLDSIEIQDNGTGISSDNYETIALRHYTSKLSCYEDIGSLKTFGFRGEALSSLCVLSRLSITTAQVNEAPKGVKLDFESSGKLRSTSTVASPKGTTVAVENLFYNLPVRRRELEKNIKREYGKALGVLQAYACISNDVKFAVSNVVVKGKKATVFATKSNPTTRDNIANIFGAKVLQALVDMDLSFDLDRKSPGGPNIQGLARYETGNQQVRVLGHVSRPILGEGRQTTDRQMFFVNSRPCGLPQVARIFNDVYKSYNISQSPFIFANIILDTDAYDVNVSPDKRTILLHDQAALLESLRISLTDLFEKQDQTIPQRTLSRPSSHGYPIIFSESLQARSAEEVDDETDHGPIQTFNPETERPEQSLHVTDELSSKQPTKIMADYTCEETQKRTNTGREDSASTEQTTQTPLSGDKYKLIKSPEEAQAEYQPNGQEGTQRPPESRTRRSVLRVQNIDNKFANQQGSIDQDSQGLSSDSEEAHGESSPKRHGQVANPSRGTLQNAFKQMRPRRISPQLATITIGSRTTTTLLPPFATRQRATSDSTPAQEDAGSCAANDPEQHFSSSMNAFTLFRNEVEKSNSIQRFADDPSIDGDQQSQSSNEVEHSSESEEYANDSFNEEEKKAEEDARVSKLIQQAEEQATDPSSGSINRATRILQGYWQKGSTTELLQIVQQSMQDIEAYIRTIHSALDMSDKSIDMDVRPRLIDEQTAEDRLSLTVSKSDFQKMSIIGQFNLGFILAVRARQSTNQEDELFIIDQHASDEKFNFERLQATTTVRNQWLVRAKPLDLTAVEEETIIENEDALVKNGFLVEIDQSGDLPVGQRCRLLSLPISREVTFGINDLEELIALLAESPRSSASAHVPRPSKVRRMFAMRACRSSVMIGRTLQKRQMETLVRHMGEIDQPWNCPHGRPTMRHIMGLRAWQEWKEGDGVQGLEESDAGEEPIDWRRWLDLRTAEDVETEGDVNDDVDEESEMVESGSGEEEEDDMEEDDRPIDHSTGVRSHFHEKENGDGPQEAVPRLSLGERFSFS
ncbi:MAG: hypothetical protein Q9167_000127 [Letrouitia subvulpina]